MRVQCSEWLQTSHMDLGSHICQGLLQFLCQSRQSIGTKGACHLQVNTSDPDFLCRADSAGLALERHTCVFFIAVGWHASRVCLIKDNLYAQIQVKIIRLLLMHFIWQ